MNRRTLSWATAVLAATGAAREAWFHLVSEPIMQLASAARERLPEAGYAQVRLLLPRTGRVGYLTDLPVSTVPGHRKGDELGTWFCDDVTAGAVFIPCLGLYLSLDAIYADLP